MIKNTFRVLSFVLLLIISLSFSSFAHQYWYYNSDLTKPLKFINGISDGTYDNRAKDNYSFDNKRYNFKRAYNEAMDEWNKKTKANIKNKDTHNGTEKLRLLADNYGNIELLGWAHMYKDGEFVMRKVQENPPGHVPIDYWDYCYSFMNVYEINLYSFSYDEYKGLAIHEIGHCFGLSHEDNEASVMNSSWVVRRENNWQLPQEDDITGIEVLYK